MKNMKSASLFQKEQVIESLKQSFVKLNPRLMIKNPIMYTVEVATVVMLFVTLYSIINPSQGSFAYNIAVFIILFITLLFANFAEAIAEARGKAQADSLRKTRDQDEGKDSLHCFHSPFVLFSQTGPTEAAKKWVASVKRSTE